MVPYQTDISLIGRRYAIYRLYNAVSTAERAAVEFARLVEIESWG